MMYICFANQWTGFCMTTASVMKKLTMVVLLNRVNLSIIWKYQIFWSRLWRSIATVWLNLVALGNPITGLGVGFLWVSHTTQLLQTSLISFQISVESNPAFLKRFLIYKQRPDQTAYAILLVFNVFYTCHHQSQISSNVQWNQSYIPFLVKSQQHTQAALTCSNKQTTLTIKTPERHHWLVSVNLLTYRHLYPDQTFEHCHHWYLCKYELSLMMIYSTKRFFFICNFGLNIALDFTYFSWNNCFIF